MEDTTPEPDGRIPYDPEVMEAMADDFGEDWHKVEQLRDQLYREALPWYAAELVDVNKRNKWSKDAEEYRDLLDRADMAWTELMGVPPLTSFDNLDRLEATVSRNGYPATTAGILAWAHGQRSGLHGQYVCHLAEFNDNDDKTITLPFPPFVGLELYFEDESFVVVEAVTWCIETSNFLLALKE